MTNIKKEVIRDLVELVPKVEKMVSVESGEINQAFMNDINKKIQEGDVKANAELAIMLLFTSKMYEGLKK